MWVDTRSSSCNLSFISVRFKKKIGMCVRILIKPSNNNFYESFFSGSVDVSYVHQTKRSTEGAISIGNLQAFERAYMFMMFVGLNFCIKWVGYLIILFSPLKLNEIQNNHTIASTHYIILYSRIVYCYQTGLWKIVASLFTK
jgi:hypothetical protein